MSDRIYNTIDDLLSTARSLSGKTLEEIYGDESKKKYGGKGGFGNKVEKLHFGIENNSRPGPDVENLGIEIKTNPLKKNNDGTYVPKESVVLGMIDFSELSYETFEKSSYLKKNNKILFNMYLYEKNTQDYNYKFLLNDIISPDSEDFEVIRRDWEIIKNKALNLNAENISQTDTEYLAAITKGQGKQKPQPYKNSNGQARAKRRAFGYKASYIKTLLENYKIEYINESPVFVKNEKKKDEITILNKYHKGNIEAAVLEKFSPFLNKTDFDIAAYFNYESAFISKKDKTRWAWNTSLILTGKKKKYLSKYIKEFSKSGLTVKTIRVNDDLLPLEEISFRKQNYNIERDSVWEESTLYDEMSRKFLWIVYKETNNKMCFLAKVFFWRMPTNDLLKIEKMWLEFKQLILNKDFRSSYFLEDKDSICYLKIKDAKGGANYEFNGYTLTSLSPWIRKNYVKNIITGITS